VRNSGARAVVEGVGDHGCEYMTGGRVVVLGGTGRNFAAGMSGGIAYVLDDADRSGGPSGDFGRYRCNREMVDLERLDDPDEIAEVRAMIEAHHGYTQSAKAESVLANWDAMLPRFVKVIPVDYRRALKRLAEEEAYRERAMVESE